MPKRIKPAPESPVELSQDEQKILNILKKKGETKTISLRIPIELNDKLERLKKDSKLSKTEVILFLIERGLKSWINL